MIIRGFCLEYSPTKGPSLRDMSSELSECFHLFGRCRGGAGGDGDGQGREEYEEPTRHGRTVSQVSPSWRG